MGSADPDFKAIFVEALDRPAGPERDAYLDRVAPRGTPLRARIDALLKADADAGRFLASNPGADPTAPGSDVATRPRPDATAEHDPDATPDRTREAPHHREPARPIPEGPGTIIGPYKLLQQIGEGGMGVVYMAEQERPIRRRVALKIIKPGMDSAQVVARFEAERQALALMDHPNIARVLDAGQTDSGRPFFVMELVDGVPITAYCDLARLNPRARLELFAQACAAAQHAHQKGIIHRDIKPSNVLVTKVDGRPTPKVIDFGVAKAIDQRLTERTLFTQFGGIVGTLEYMSPEQASLGSQDVDTRSDIYALGVLLYELLTGSTPLDRASPRQAGYAEILRRIQEEEPPRPSTRLSGSGDRLPSIAAVRDVEPARLPGLVRGELDWIVMKALEKDRTRRYETASGLARDIGRYLDGDPVEACPPSRSYRLRKFARKHRAALATASSFALLLLSAAGVSTALAFAADRARRDAITEARNADEARRRAEAAEAKARDETDNARAINEFLTRDLLTQAEPANNAVEDRVTLLEVLDRSAAKVGDRFAGRPRLEASLRRTIAETYHGLASWEKAESQWRALLDLALADDPDSPQVHGTMGMLAHTLSHRGRVDAEALAMGESAFDGLARTLGPDHPDTLACRLHLAEAYNTAGRGPEAIGMLGPTLERMEARLGSNHEVTVTARGKLAEAYIATGRAAEAIDLLESTLQALEARLEADDPATIVARSNLAAAYATAGRDAEAIALLEPRLKALEARLGPEDPHTLTSHTILGEAYGAVGRVAEAIDLLGPTLKRMEARLGPDHPNTIGCRGSLSVAYWAAGRGAEAALLQESNLAMSEAKLGHEHWLTIRSVHFLAHALDHDRPHEAEPLFRRALEHYRRAEGPVGPLTLDLTRDLGTLLDRAGRPAEAEPLLRTLVEAMPSEHPGRADSLAPLGLNLLTQRKWAEAEPLLRECLALREKAIPDDWRTASTRSMLGGSLLGQEKHAEAEPLVLSGYEAIKARETAIPPGGRARLSEAAERVVRLYESWGKPDRAAEWEDKLKVDLPPPSAATSP